jgi:hypothetical protein
MVHVWVGVRLLCKAKGKQKKFHAINVVESAGEINSNLFTLTMSNIVGNNSNVESMAICNVVAIKIVQLIAIKVQATL